VHSLRFIQASRCGRHGIFNGIFKRYRLFKYYRIFKRHALLKRYSYLSVIEYLIIIECASVIVYSSVIEYSRLRHVLLLSNSRGPCMHYTLLLSGEFLGAGRAYLIFLAPH